MDKLKEYGEKVQQIIGSYAASRSSLSDGIEIETVFDQKNGHYQLVYTGWRGRRNQYGCTIHVDVKPDGKIWIQRDRTEVGIANELIEAGIPKKDIVLAFLSPFARQHTEFAVA